MIKVTKINGYFCTNRKSLNFLAHIYLSGSNKNIALGNLIGDMVKGQSYKNYPLDIKNGILLHRAIDDFTDKHPEFLHTKNMLKPYFNRYSGVVTDIYFDYFLAKNWSEYCEQDLQKYVNEMYVLLINKYAMLPKRAQQVVPMMIIRNWLGSYGNLERLHYIFLGMHRRTQQNGAMDKAVEVLQLHQENIEPSFQLFFRDVKIYSQEQLQKYTY